MIVRIVHLKDGKPFSTGPWITYRKARRWAREEYIGLATRWSYRLEFKKRRGSKQ